MQPTQCLSAVHSVGDSSSSSVDQERGRRIGQWLAGVVYIRAFMAVYAHICG